MKESTRGFASLILLAVTILMAGCGGGNGGGNNVVSLGQGATANQTLQIANASLALNAVTTVTTTFTDLQGKAISNLPVTFSTTLGSLTPSTGLVTTDANGVAAIQLSASGGGSGTVTATATVSGGNLSKTIPFSVDLPPISISSPVLGLTSLAPGGTTSVTVTLSDSSGTFTTPVDVFFTSTFAAAGKATLTTPVRTVNGVATSTYTAAGGVGLDTITVQVGNATASTSLSVAGTTANSISFVSTSPKVISLRGMGGTGSETSTVVFRVLDNTGQPAKGQTVDFALNTTVGGLALTASSAISDSSGNVSTIVQSGIIATPIRVTASIRGSSPLVATQSDQLVVSTGIPAQDGMSLAVTSHNVEAAFTDGVADTFTVFLADHFGNPVPDGTSVSFIAQAGQIQPSCSTLNGRCSAIWTSSGARTPDGRIAILAYAIGEESFADVNGSGLAEGTCAGGSLQASALCGEFTDTTQAWRDDLHTGVYAPPGTVAASFPNFPGDFFIDFNGSGKVDRDAVYNGILRPASATGARTKHVFQNNVIVASSSAASIAAFGAGSLSPATAAGSVTTTITSSVKDSNILANNPMPSGTRIDVASLNTCLTVAPASFTVPNTPGGATVFSTVVTNSCLTGVGSPGTLSVTVTSPSGVVTIRNSSFTW